MAAWGRRHSVPALQYVIRLTLLIFWGVYWITAPASPLISPTLALVFTCFYLAFHASLFWVMRRYGKPWRVVSLSILMDMGLAWMVWLYDPLTPPPLMIYTVIVIVGNAIQYGIRAFRLLTWAALVISPISLSLRWATTGMEPFSGFCFLLCLFIIWYVYKFIFRIESFRRETEKRTEALERSEQNYRNIFENTGSGAVIVGDDLIISQTNARFERMTGYTRKEIEGTVCWLDFVHPEDLKRLRREHKARIEMGGEPPREYDFRLLRKDGEVIDVFAEVNYDPAEKRAMASVIDISLRKHAERALKEAHDELEKRVEERTEALIKANDELKIAKEEADASGLAKSQFLANMSHEIRTPMNAIIGMCDLVLGTELSIRQKEYVNIVRSSSRSLLELINDILDFSKIDAGKLDLEKIPLVLRDVVEEVSDMFLEKSMGKDLELIIDIDDDVPRKVISDPLRLRQVLANLTANAFKFTNRGEICISVKTEYVDQKAATLKFTVRDTGIGIREDQKERLFDAFAQADGSTTRKYGGTGLGLAICKKIVEMLGGKIWVESEAGQGSSFHFTVEVRLMPDEKRQSGMALPPTLRGKKVLVVDDNPSTLMILKRYMDTFGFRTEMANTGEAALALHDRSVDVDPFALVIMDIRLPGIDGVEAIAQLKKRCEGREKPVVICISAYGREKDIERARESGAESFLMKPVKQSILFDTIMELFGFKAVRRSSATSGLASSQEFSDLTLLLVEDNPINQMVAMEILKSAGITVETAENGREAVEMVTTGSYDAVLMDVQMPEMDGLDATRHIRRKLHKEELPIIAMTAHAMYGDRERCLASGMTDYVPKPIDRNELFSALRRNITKLSGEYVLYSGGDDGLTVSENTTQFMLPGVNVSRGLLDVQGQWELFGLKLQDFLVGHKKVPASMGKAMEEGQLDELCTMAKDLASEAASVSALGLEEWSRAMEEAAADGNLSRCREILFPLEEAMVELERSTEQLVCSPKGSDPGGESTVHLDPEHLFTLIQTLKKSLEEADPVGSEKVLCEMDQGFSFSSVSLECEGLKQSLEERVREYSFEQAVSVLNRLDGKLRGALAP